MDEISGANAGGASWRLRAGRFASIALGIGLCDPVGLAATAIPTFLLVRNAGVAIAGDGDGADDLTILIVFAGLILQRQVEPA